MQYQEAAARFTGQMTDVIRPRLDRCIEVARERMGSVRAVVTTETQSIWSNADVRDDIIRTAIFCGAILCVVTVLVFVTAWLAIWLRLAIICLTLGILGKWLMSKIADSSDGF